jgi:hypothetical protein
MQCYGKIGLRHYSRVKSQPKVDVSKIESVLHIHKLGDWYNVPKVHLAYADKNALKQYLFHHHLILLNTYSYFSFL